MDFIKWSWKAIIATFGPIIIYLIEANQEAINSWVLALVGAVLTGIATWIKKNGPAPASMEDGS